MYLKREKLKYINAFSLLEVIISIVIIGVLSTLYIKINKTDELNNATNRLILYLKHTRLHGFINHKYESSNELWFKRRWTLKFFRCQKSVGGIYYTIYSDENLTGHPSMNESLKDSLTGKNIYSSNRCNQKTYNSPHVLLTQMYNIEDVSVSCNSTKSLGQISFGDDGNVYSRLSNELGQENSYEITKPCMITISHKNGESKVIIVENRTGYIYKK